MTLGWNFSNKADGGIVGGQAVTAASTKITLAGSPSTAALKAFSIDVNQANLDHGSIGGLADDDHTQYRLESANHSHASSGLEGGTLAVGILTGGQSLSPSTGQLVVTGALCLIASETIALNLSAGKSGGDTLAGGTASGEDLTLSSTTHATKGSIFLGASSAYEEASKFLGLGVTTPTGSLAQSLEIRQTTAPSTNNSTAVMIASTLNGTADGPQLLAVAGIFAPSTSISVVYGFLNLPSLRPIAGITITQANAGFCRVDTGSTGGAVTIGVGLEVGAPNLGTIKPGSIYGIEIQNQGAASVGTAIGLKIAAQSGATNNYVFDLPTDATDPTGGGGAATGRIKCLIGGATRYIPYY
jgi:hypothetical protein